MNAKHIYPSWVVWMDDVVQFKSPILLTPVAFPFPPIPGTPANLLGWGIWISNDRFLDRVHLQRVPGNGLWGKGGI